MEPRFIGDPNSQLLCIHHRAQGVHGNSKRAVVICPPIGQEYVQTHWSLRLFANQLARKGVHVLRLDYYGIGDSAGEIEDVTSTAVWRQNIATAIQHLQDNTGVETVTLVGLRLGATLAAQVADNNPNVNAVVLWEPVADGREYLDALRSNHHEMLDLWVRPIQTPNDETQEEILGSRYSRELIREIEQTTLDSSSIVQPQLIVQLESDTRSFSHPTDGIQRVSRVADNDDWSDLRRLEVAWLRPTTIRMIVDSVDDMFDRLDRFEALSLPDSGMQLQELTAGVQR